MLSFQLLQSEGPKLNLKVPMPVTASVGPLLRVPRTDVEGDRFILLQAKPAASSALSSTPTELDVYLQATEGEAAYGVQSEFRDGLIGFGTEAT